MVINTLRPRQNGRHFADDIFKPIFLNENIRISTKISLKFVSKGPINNIPALVLIMAWRRPGYKPLSEPMMVRSLTHICVTRPQWVNTYFPLGLVMHVCTSGLESSSLIEMIVCHLFDKKLISCTGLSNSSHHGSGRDEWKVLPKETCNMLIQL